MNNLRTERKTINQIDMTTSEIKALEKDKDKIREAINKGLDDEYKIC